MSVPSEQVSTDLATAVNAGITASSGQTATAEAELKAVKNLNTEYKVAREFDRYAREQYNQDRRYAQGVASPNWASDANIIGSFIDILVSFIYAQNPDVSVRPGPQTGGQPDKNMTDFSETLQIVVSRLWRDARLKKTMRKMVRAALSVGAGWMKALVYSEQRRNPELEKQIRSVNDNLERIEALKKMLGEGDTSQDETMTKLNNQMTGLQGQVELLVKRGLCADFCRSEDVQISLDISDTADYIDADWISNDMYVTRDVLRSRFPDLTDEDCKTAAVYYQRQTGASDKNTADTRATTDKSADGAFTKDQQGGGSGVLTMGGDKPVEFVKIVELWDHRDTLIKTFVDGVTKWPVQPYSPPQASTRFYPYFRLAFYEVDGSRHPQSLSWRLRKLQDEYSHTRSNNRLARERSVPGIVFNKGQLSEEDTRKITESTQQEWVGVQLTTPDADINKIMTSKPIPRVDPALYDTNPIKYDMEVLSGVQEAQQGAQSSAKTATEANIQQSGFNSRTGADRDSIEDMLSDLAQYTAELSVQSLDIAYVQKIAGPLAFWPVGIETQDVLQMLEVEISAGTTGKPQAHADKETWATLMPLIMNALPQIQQLDVTNPPLAKGYRNLINETLHRLDDRLDIDSIIPQSIAPPVAPGLPGAAPGEASGLPPTGVPPVGNGTVNNPGTIPAPPAAA